MAASLHPTPQCLSSASQLYGAPMVSPVGWQCFGVGVSHALSQTTVAPAAFAPFGAPATDQTTQLNTPMVLATLAQLSASTTRSKLSQALPRDKEVDDLVARKSAGGLQESDRLEQLGNLGGTVDASMCRGTEHIRLVSLGNTCGPKLSFQQLGRGAETLPFDWMRTRIEGLLHFMRSDFQGFFDYVTCAPAQNMVMYRSQYHSFWHDNPDDAGMRDRYTRRIRRFQTIDASIDPVLFVRVANGSEELAWAGELLGELKARFGPQARLLYVLDFQYATTGPVLVQGLDGLLVYFHKPSDRSPAAAPYKKPVCIALRWAAGQGVDAKTFPSLAQVVKAADRTEWGYTAHGQLAAFEPLLNSTHVVARGLSSGALVGPSQRNIDAPSPSTSPDVPLYHAEALRKVHSLRLPQGRFTTWPTHPA